MSFICYVETLTSEVPYMEPLAVDTLDEARVHAHRLLAQHRRPVAAHIFHGDERVDTITP